MKIVQTFWSKPLLNCEGNQFSDRNTGGWHSPCYFFIGWTLSFLYLHKWFQNISLVSDEVGFKCLIEEIGLPYEKFAFLPDRLMQYDSRLWALPKIFAYQYQTEPFLHIDGDVFIRSNLLSRFENSKLVVEHIEQNVMGCYDVLKDIFQIFKFIPREMGPLNESGSISFINAGVIGGCDLQSFAKYTELALSFVETNRDSLHLIDPVKFNLIFEQYLFHNMFSARQPISEIISETTKNSISLHLPIKLASYIHLVGENKKNIFNCLLLSLLLKLEFPDFYERVILFCLNEYGEAAVNDHKRNFEPFYSRHTRIIERIIHCNLDELLNFRYKLTNGYFIRQQKERKLSEASTRKWEQALSFFQKENTGNELCRQFRIDTSNPDSVSQLKMKVADLIVTNLVKEHNLEFA